MPQLFMPPPKLGETVWERVKQKHEEYNKSGKWYRFLYYATRLTAGLCAGILPFVVYSMPGVATGLSIAIVVVTVFDTVFNPKERWKTMSRASDLLYIAELKRQGKYKEFEEALNVILSTEEQQMLQLLGLDEVIKKSKDAAAVATPKSDSEAK